ncbi:CHL4-domain-containing protein, partial [Morchella conica CCBAS932]
SVEGEKKGEQGEEGKRRRVAEGRFGGEARVGDGRGLESVEFVVEDVFPPLAGAGGGAGGEEEGGEEWRPSVGVKLEGAHVFAGVRSLVEAGVVFDGVKMPGWMTGEGGVSFGMVRDGVLVKRRK